MAIDGPSSAGKSTVARELARRLGVPYIDTGAMYRAVGLAAKERGVRLPIQDPSAVASLVERLQIELDTSARETRVFLDGRDISDAIRHPEISLYASAVSAIPAVRRILVEEQRRLTSIRGGILEGRDIGTQVFPETPHKFFLTASAEIRAERRARELWDRGTPRPYGEVLEEMERRDRDDRGRADSPLTFDGRYVLVDSGGRQVTEIVEELERRIRG